MLHHHANQLKCYQIFEMKNNVAIFFEINNNDCRSVRSLQILQNAYNHIKCCQIIKIYSNAIE